MYIYKELIEDKFDQIIDWFNERKITSTNFYSMLLNEIYPFYDGNGRTCKILKWLQLDSNPQPLSS